MIRRFVSSMAIASLVLAVAVLALWVQNIWCTDEVSCYDDAIWGGELASSDGLLRLTIRNDEFDIEDPVDLRVGGWEWTCRGPGDYLFDLELPQWRWGSFGLSWRVESIFWGYARHRTWIWVVQSPHWFAALLFSVPPVIWWVRSWRRYKPGECPACGYDLRGSVAARACPECGSPVSSIA